MTSGKGVPACAAWSISTIAAAAGRTTDGCIRHCRKHFAQDAAIDRIVVHHEHWHAFELTEVGVPDVWRGCVQHRQPHGKMERRSFAHGALHPDAPTHVPHELRGDGKSEAGAAVGSRGRTVDLRERLENQCSFFLRNADTRIRDREMQAMLVVRRGLDRDGYRHVAALSELDRVVGQIDKDLSQSHRVADQVIGTIAEYVRGQFETLLVARFRGLE